MIRNPIDIAGRVSPELSDLIQTIIDHLETGEPVTLAAVRAFVANELPREIGETEEMHHFDNSESLVDELDGLIEQFGESADAADFIHAFASEALTRAIGEVMDDENREAPPTLAAVREALLEGLAGRLVGEGVLEDDEAEGLLLELDKLIERFGDDAPAEEFLRYE